MMKITAIAATMLILTNAPAQAQSTTEKANLFKHHCAVKQFAISEMVDVVVSDEGSYVLNALVAQYADDLFDGDGETTRKLVLDIVRYLREGNRPEDVFGELYDLCLLAYL